MPRRSSTAASAAWRGAALGAGGALVITADHGNIEEMRDAAGNPQTKHTTAPVPLVLVGDGRTRPQRCGTASLADVAPTLCELLGIPPGPGMTGRSLLEVAGAAGEHRTPAILRPP